MMDWVYTFFQIANVSN